MKNIKIVALAASALTAMCAPATASAANWDPPNTAFTPTASLLVYEDAAGNTFRCTVGDAVLTATLATATGRPSFSSCTEPIFASSPIVVTTGDWTYTATSTTSVDLRAVNPAGGNVMEIVLLSGACTITVPSPVNIPNSTWNNTTHQLTFNGTATFPIATDGSCIGVTSPARLTTTFTFPSNVIIT